MTYQKKFHTFNRHKSKVRSRRSTQKIKTKKHEALTKLKNTQISKAKSGVGLPESNVKNPIDGFIYVDQDTADTYVYFKKLGWISLSGFYPDVGEGAPDKENPPSPLTGDQYVDILSGDFYVYADGFGWKMNTGSSGPQGPPGPAFSIDFATTMGPTGPIISGPFKLESGKQVQMWVTDGSLYADVV